MTTSLENAIIKQRDLLLTLKELLEKELHLISSKDPEFLIQLLKEKEQLLGDIESQDEAIEILYVRNEKAGKGVDEKCQALFDECKQILEECKYLTEINTRCVEQGQLRLVHLRNTMLELRTRESMTYDKAGKAKGSNSGKGISV